MSVSRVSRAAFAMFLLAFPFTVVHADVVAFDPPEVNVPAPPEKGGPVPGTAFLYCDEPALLDWSITAVADRGAVDGPAGVPLRVEFEKVELLSKTPKRTEWKATLSITGLERLTTVQRKAVIEFTKDASVEKRSALYTITNAAKNFTWTIDAESKSLVSPPNDEMTIVVRPAGGLATNLDVASSSLQSPDTEAKIGRESIELSGSLKGDAIPVLIGGTPTPVYVRIDKDVPFGSYTGTIDLRVDQSADVKSFPLTFHKTSNPIRFLGALLILAGILTSLGVTVFARTAMATAQALLPAARLRELVSARRVRLAACRVDKFAPNTVQALNDLERSLRTSALRKANYVPSPIANPFGSDATDATDYAEFLQNAGNELRSIGFVIDKGFCTASTMIDWSKQAHHAALQTACRSLDKLDLQQTAELLGPQIAPILGALNAAIAPPNAAALPPPQFQTADAPSTEQLLWRVAWISGVLWLVWAIITLLVGGLAMIATNPGFGTWIDLLKCFLWGLGVQIAGQQLQNLTPAAVTSSLGVTVPKS